MNELNTNKVEDRNMNSSSWLKRLKEESWEAELLVSTVAIFGTFKLFGLINWWTNLFIDMLSPSQYFVGYMIVFFGLLAIAILASMFVIHFILRAYWVGLVGLNSVFPDYSIKDSAFSEVYTKRMLTYLPKLKDSIKKVDELCSVIFSVAFSSLFMYAYMALLASIYLFVFNLLSPYISKIILLIPVFIVVMVLVLQITFSFLSKIKKYKNNSKAQAWYFKIVKWTYLIICGPFNKAVLQVMIVFGSNFKKKKSMVYLLYTFVFSGFLVVLSQFNQTNIPYLIKQGLSVDKTRVNPVYYASENNENDFLLVPEIKSDIIKEAVLKVFIPIFSHEKEMRKNTCDDYIKDEKKTKEKQKEEEFRSDLNCYKSYHHIFVNGEKIKVDFFKYDHPRTNQFGILGYIKLKSAKEGLNILKIKKVFDKSENDKDWSIPFYYLAK